MLTLAEEINEKEYGGGKGVEGTLVTLGIEFVHDFEHKLFW
jgi:hypothetical protein